MINTLRIRQEPWEDNIRAQLRDEEPHPEFQILDGDKLLGEEKTLNEAIAFAQGVLGDAHDNSFSITFGCQQVVLELCPVSVAFDSSIKTAYTAHSRGINHPRSNHRLVEKLSQTA